MYLIVGIDPGKTSGIVCLDLNGKIVFRDHALFGGLEWFINAINRTGTPVITAGDKPKASEIVKKINASFNSKLFCPAKELKIEEKRRAAKNLNIKNPHERDAYIAAISAYNAYSNKFKQAERLAHMRDYKDIDEIKAKVVEKYSINEVFENRKANRR